MKTRNFVDSLLMVAVIGICGCSGMHQNSAEAPERGEKKVRLDQTPVAVRQTIERELVGGELEDIAMKKRQGKTIYETDIIRNGHKIEVVVGEDGQIISNAQEGSPAEKQAEKGASAKTGQKGWRDTFDVNKGNLQPTGNNPYLTIQPGRVLKMVAGKDRLTVSILPETKIVDGVTTGVLE